MATNLGDLLRAKGFDSSGDEAPEPEPTAAPGARFAPKVVVRATRKGRGGKTVTTVQGLTGDLKAEAKALKKTLGTGARVEDDLVVVQGDQCDRVVAWLEREGAKKVVRG